LSSHRDPIDFSSAPPRQRSFMPRALFNTNHPLPVLNPWRNWFELLRVLLPTNKVCPDATGLLLTWCVKCGRLGGRSKSTEFDEFPFLFWCFGEIRKRYMDTHTPAGKDFQVIPTHDMGIDLRRDDIHDNLERTVESSPWNSVHRHRDFCQLLPIVAILKA